MTRVGIHPPYEALYIEAMLWHTSSAAQSIADLSAWLEYVYNDDERALKVPKTELFDHLQNILHQAGCISRYLFPSRTRPVHLQRAATLREAFDVKDNNPLANRGLRDALEHFDERLDRYLAVDRVGQFIPNHVGYEMPKSDVPLHIFKGFYIGQLTFVLLGEPYEMAHIVDELGRLHEVLIDSVKNGHRLPSGTQ